MINNASAVAIAAKNQTPRPAATPIAAASQRLAPVVSPLISPREKTIIPAARKATPLVTASIVRIGSIRTSLPKSRPTSSNVSRQKQAEARPTNIWVRSPAGRSCDSRSKPMHPERSRAPKMRRKIMVQGNWLCPLNSSLKVLAISLMSIIYRFAEITVMRSTGACRLRRSERVLREQNPPAFDDDIFRGQLACEGQCEARCHDSHS